MCSCTAVVLHDLKCLSSRVGRDGLIRIKDWVAFAKDVGVPGRAQSNYSSSRDKQGFGESCNQNSRDCDLIPQLKEDGRVELEIRGQGTLAQDNKLRIFTPNLFDLLGDSIQTHEESYNKVFQTRLLYRLWCQLQ